ncbi:hypothetical protein PV327_009471 [Microctonus hyperodae]|uniref:Uncharacterized protein n=1 Tax=Microctonus hyperodae TaxID=165561 RepID=A0AA39FUX5_MICHY|nr:hypothetical protein PV327_009471 [Microctonus hyperodae]
MFWEIIKDVFGRNNASQSTPQSEKNGDGAPKTIDTITEERKQLVVIKWREVQDRHLKPLVQGLGQVCVKEGGERDLKTGKKKVTIILFRLGQWTTCLGLKLALMSLQNPWN